MKNFLKCAGVLITATLFLYSCEGVGDGNRNRESGVSSPMVEQVVLYQEVIDGEEVPVVKFYLKDMYDFKVTASDSDMDMYSLYMEQYLLPDTGIPYYPEPMKLLLPTQTAEVVDYMSLDSLTVPGEAGEWRLCFWIVDIQGNESDDFCLTIIVKELKEE